VQPTENAPATPVTVLMVGVGGYGHYFLQTLREQMRPERARLCGIVDPLAHRSEYYPRWIEDPIPIFDDIEAYYQAGRQADLSVIASPIHFHAHQSCVALNNGSHVLCEKPIAPVVQEADLLSRTAEGAGRWCMIGYQWSFSHAIQNLKRDIRRGLFGEPLRLKTLIFWPRDDAYYQRNGWAGRIKDNCGRWILDSPANNAMAHYLHNLFYLLGEETASSAVPSDVVAELYRANPIENFDTAVCRAHTNRGTELLFYGTHATRGDQDPMFQLEFENAVIRYNDPTPEIVVRTRQDECWTYGSPEDDPQFKKLFDAVHAVHALDPLLCGPAAARAQCVCVNGMQESVPVIASFSTSMVQRDEEKKRWLVVGLDDTLRECYRQGVLPSELHIPWASQGKSVDLRGYDHYPSRPANKSKRERSATE